MFFLTVFHILSLFHTFSTLLIMCKGNLFFGPYENSTTIYCFLLLNTVN